MKLRVRILQGAWQSVNCDRCVMSSTGTCVGLILCQEESYLVCVCVCVCVCEGVCEGVCVCVCV